VVGAVALAGVYLVVHLIAPAAMGAGDVKLALGIGALTGSFGFDVWTLAAVGAPLLTAAWALVVVRRQRTVPHGPSMCLATVAAAMLAIV
jgi:leader peptidase (prepilin peptidase)/N-methyltransferase